MGKQLNWQSIKNILIIVLVLGIILFFLYECHRDIENGDANNKPPENAYDYKTLITYKDKYFKLKDSLRDLKPIQPSRVDNWLSPKTVKVDSVAIIKDYLKIYKGNMDIVYKGSDKILTFDTNPNPLVTIKSDFILNYTDSPKLLEFNLVKDSISINLFTPDAEVKTYNYPIYLDNYGYSFDGSMMSMYNNPVVVIDTKKPKMRWDNLYINGGYDIYTKAPTSGLEYNLSPGRFKLDLNAEVLILQQPKLNLNAKVGYRLFK